MTTSRKRRATAPPPLYVVSGGVGASGEQLVQTVLAQFPDNNLPVITVGNVRQVTQIKRVIAQAKQAGGIEVQAALRVFRRGRFAVIDVTDKPIETSADEIIKLIESHAKS